MEDENGGVPIAYPGKPYVDNDLKTNVGGTFTGQVGVLNATANVFSIKCKCKSDFQLWMGFQDKNKNSVVTLYSRRRII